MATTLSDVKTIEDFVTGLAFLGTGGGGGRLQDGIDLLTPLIKAGKLRPIAVTSRQRSSAAPDVVTVMYGRLMFVFCAEDNSFFAFSATPGFPTGAFTSFA